MTFEQFIEIEDNKNKIDSMISYVYYNNRTILLDDRYTLDEFQSECYLRIISKWNNYEGHSKRGTYIGSIIKYTPNEIFNLNKTQKRILTNLKMCKSYEVERDEFGYDVEDNTENVINLNSENLIDTVINAIPDKDKEYVRLYIQYNSLTKVSEITGKSTSTLQYIIKHKYKDLIHKTVLKYSNNKISC